MVRFCTILIGFSSTCPSHTEISGDFRSPGTHWEILNSGTSLAHVQPSVMTELRSIPVKKRPMGVNFAARLEKETAFSERTKQVVWFTSGALCGLAMLSICKASIPSSNGLSPSNVTDDTAIYQNLSEIQLNKDRAPNFDADIANLSQMERRYHEKPALRQTRQVARRKLPAPPAPYQN
jgi:hypothetical protein